MPPDIARLDAFAMTSLNVGGGDDDDDVPAAVADEVSVDEEDNDSSALAGSNKRIDDESKAVDAKKDRLFKLRLSFGIFFVCNSISSKKDSNSSFFCCIVEPLDF